MNDTTKLVLRIAGYTAFFAVFFAYFLYLGFPYDAVKDMAVQKIEENSRLRLEILHVAPDMFSGFNLRDVRIYHEDAVATQMVGKIDKANVDLGLLSLIGGALKLGLDLDLYEGNISGKVREGGGVLDADLKIENVNLSRYDLSPFLAKIGDFRINGILNGALDLHYDQADLKAAKGTVELDAQGLRLAETNVYGFKIPAITFEPSTIRLDLGSRALKIVDGKLNGDNVSVVLGGRMTLRDDLSRSNFSYHLKFKPSGELDEQFGSMLSAVKKKDREGFYRINLTGSPANPRFR